MKARRSWLITSARVVSTPVREAGIDFQRATLEQFDREQRGVFVRNNLIVVFVHHERRHVDVFQVFRLVRLGERFNSIVMGLCSAHHTLSPPILDHAL
jgi:hypothetical protein